MDFSWTIVGPGSIANRFAEAVRHTPGARLGGVCGRDEARSAAFAARWAPPDGAPPRAVTDVDALLGLDRVDGVYIATPHSHHDVFIEACLRAGKPVLCEKPLVVNRPTAERLVALARARRVFLMEALWTRFLPIYEVIGSWLDEGAIGRLRYIQSSFCFPTPFDAASRLFAPALAGGALLDTGIYNLSMAHWAIARATRRSCPEPSSIDARALLAPSGVDMRVMGTLWFPGDVGLQFTCGYDSEADNAMHICGDAGRIAIPNRFWEARDAVLQRPGREPEARRLPFRVNGFEYQLEEAMACIGRGALQSERIRHEDSCAVIGWMDEIRRRIGVAYPFE